MSQKLVNVTIDGRTLQVPAGTLLVEAAKQVGIDIPVFCYHPKLEPAGVCRMCLVQIEKIPKPQTACTTRVGDGMVVHTQNNSELAAELQKGVLEFLLINHPLDCPVCDKGGECDLQDLTFKYGPSTSRLQDAKVQKPKSVDLGNFIVLDNERCILCRRCTRFDDEIATEGNLIVEERGHHNCITTLPNERYDSYFSGNTIELCPVGALTSELYRFKARPWDLAKVESICTGCSVGCNDMLEFRHGSLLRITGRDVPAINDSWLCDRGRFNYKFVQGENRLTQPMVNQNGTLVPATWTEAINLIAAKVKSVKAAKGGKGFGVIGGGKLANEEAYLLQKFARLALGTNNVDHRVSDQMITSFSNFPGSQADLSAASAILILDTNVAETAPVMDLRIRKMADRKLAKIAVVGSVSPKYRGRHGRILVKPGETAGVVTALAAVAAGRKPLQSAADPVAVQKMAQLLSNGNKVVIVWGGNEATTGRALIDLANSLNKAGENGRSVHILIPGAQNNSRGAEIMGVLPTFLPGFVSLSDQKGREAVGHVWNSRNLPVEVGLSTNEILKSAAEGEVQMLFLNGANLLNTYPDRDLALQAVSKSFTVVTDLFLNETAAQADVVLPAATIGEKSGTYTALDGLVQHVKAAKRLEGDARPDAEILVGLAAALGVKLAAAPQETNREIAKLVTRLEEGTVLKGAPVTLVPTNGLSHDTANGPSHGTADGLVLVPVDRLYAGGSTAQFDVEFNFVQPKPAAFFNPVDAVNLGLTRGEQVELSTSGGALQLPALIDKSVVPGTVQVIKGLPAAPANLLTSGGGSAPVTVTVAKLAVEVAD